MLLLARRDQQIAMRIFTCMPRNLMHGCYANRLYSPREQVNKFINELSPVFSPAVSRVRRLLDAWNPFDLTVPEVLKVTALPNTIERFMTEETGQSYIRKLQDKRTSRQRNSKPNNDKELVDKYCSFCGMHGHITTNCEFMAKLLQASEMLCKIDAKAKKELKETYRNEQQKRREKRLQKHTKIIRQLIDTGASKEDIETALNDLHNQCTYSDAKNSNSTDSTTD
jgi:hypothetical protein